MFYRIQALFLSIALFFVGFIYKDTPIEIEYTVHINGTEISAGDNIEIPLNGSLTVACLCKNVGRPFEGETFYTPRVSFYKYVNGEKEYLHFWSITVDAGPQPILIKNGETFDIFECFEINPDDEPAPGVYSMEVSAYGCEQIFENVLKIV